MRTERQSAEEIIKHYGLKPLPLEGGFYRQSYRDEHSSSIYYLITHQSFSALHSLSVAELWHFYAGDPVQMMQLSPAGELGLHIMGPDWNAGHQCQTSVGANHFQGARLVAGGSWALFGCTVSPAYQPEFYKHGQRCELIQKYPQFFDVISRFSRA